ncbi:MAG TPA: hypothetical protein PKZ56_00290 [Candidatus Paceibacterota bacterium]|nr:hypothetical protein [Candidatus Paceibacterota bacterium]
MNEKLKQQFEEQLIYLPDINQQALKSFDWATQLLSIGHQYGLHIDQLEDLQMETMMLLVGLISPEQYPDHLTEKLAVSPTEISKIIEQINHQVFIPIHDYIINGGDNPITTPENVMGSAGLEITTDETPINTAPPGPTIRTGGSTPINQVVPDTKPESIIPLQFRPTPMPTIPQSQIPNQVLSPALLSKEKLEKLVQDRQKTIDASIQSMDQSK